MAFVDRCPHRHSPLSLGHCEAGVLHCAYHGWRFDALGPVRRDPRARAPTASLPPGRPARPPAGLTERHGMVFLAPEEPLAPLGTMPEADDPAFMAGSCPPCGPGPRPACWPTTSSTWPTFPFVHAGTFGADEAAEVPAYAVARDGWSFTVATSTRFANREDPGVAAGLRPLSRPPPHLPAGRAVPSAPAHRLPRRRRDQRHRVLHPARDGRDAAGSSPPCGGTTSAATGPRMAEAVDFEVAVLREDLVSRRPTTSWSSRSTPRPRCTPGPTAPPWSCAGCWPTWCAVGGGAR